MHELLKEYLALTIERIRKRPADERGVKTRFGDHFDISRFKKLDDADTMRAYAAQFLDVLGTGSSRSAYLLRSKRVLKIALNEKGLAQNEAELDVFTNPRSKPIVAKVYDADAHQRWLVSDLVRPVANVEEFKSLTGLDWVDEFGPLVSAGIQAGRAAPDSPALVKAIVDTARENNLLSADIMQTDFSKGVNKNTLGHWGKTPDGRVVLLDYGYTAGVYITHYSHSSSASEADTPTNVMSKRPTGAQRSTPHAATQRTSADEPTKKR